MCGIYGFQKISDVEDGLSSHDTSLLTYILAKDMENRGKDSFGGICLPDGYSYKGLGRVSEVGVKLLRSSSASSAFLGHTRAATVGEVSIKNCHPFWAGDIVGVHNGSIYNYAELNAKYNRECEVDSEHIFHHLNEGLPLEEIEGHGTFFWTQASESLSNIYFARTGSGQLTISKVYRLDNSDKTPIAIVWASETWGLRKALKILGLGMVEISTTSGEIYRIYEGEVIRTERSFPITSKYTYTSTKPSNVVSYLDAQDEEDGNWLQNMGWRGRPWQGHKSDVNIVADNSKVEDASDTYGIAHSLIFLLANQHLSRKDRKSLRRKLAFFHTKNKHNIKEPDPEKIHNGVGLKRSYVTGLGGEVGPVLYCQDCQCDVRDHIWGWCLNDTKATCKAKIGQGCSFGTPDIKICATCGHYLVETVHYSAEKYSGVTTCRLCDGFCIPQASSVVSRTVASIEDKNRGRQSTAPIPFMLVGDLSLAETSDDISMEPVGND